MTKVRYSVLTTHPHYYYLGISDIHSLACLASEQGETLSEGTPGPLHLGTWGPFCWHAAPSQNIQLHSRVPDMEWPRNKNLQVQSNNENPLSKIETFPIKRQSFKCRSALLKALEES